MTGPEDEAEVEEEPLVLLESARTVRGRLMCGCGGCIETCPSCMEEETCLDCHTCPPFLDDDDLEWDEDVG